VSDERRQCGAITSKGTPCRTYAVHGSEPPRCMFHIDRSLMPADKGPMAPLTVEEEVRGLTSEWRRLLRTRPKSLETTRLILALSQAIKDLTGLAPSAEHAKKGDPAWMKKFRP